MANNVDMVIKGIKCDNPNCDFLDTSVLYEDYPKWVNKSCPKCGANLLTKKDYNLCKVTMKLAKLLNFFPTMKGEKVYQQLNLNGEGLSGVRYGKYFNILMVKGDITQIECDAIVNIANETNLLNGGNIYKSIYKVAGKELLKECINLGGCKVTEAKLTKGYNLPCSYIVHTVLPKYEDLTNERQFEELLRKSYQNCLQLIANNGLNNVLFPCMEDYPKEKTRDIAIDVVSKFLVNHRNMRVTFVCNSQGDYDLYNSALFI